MIKFFNIYYLFFSIALSAAVYPSIMGDYGSNEINLGIIFILDELILLSSIILMVFHIFTTKRISNKISGYGFIPVYVLSWIIVVFALSFLRTDNSFDVISRDRWIILNAMIFLMPFVYQPTFDDLALLFRRFFIWILILAIIKLVYFFLVGQTAVFSLMGPGFTFILSLCLAVYLFHSVNILRNLILSIFVLSLSILSQQLSSIVLTLLCVLVPVTFTYFKTFFSRSLFFLGCISIAIFFMPLFDVASIAYSFNLNPLNFTLSNNINSYLQLWTATLNDISFIDFIFGRGAGYSFSQLSYIEDVDGYGYAVHSLAHNFLFTILMKFGLVGVVLFSIMIFKIYQPLSRKLNFNTSLLLKLVLALILINFLTTPGLWKIRKGIFFWFFVGLCYLYRRDRATENVK